ncbi:MAG TPA: multidrug effflux MFS transporter [Acidiphilium sp.]|nr:MULTISPECIES: multidrug effflux MFS transporter [unclassified Acidiphilium]OYV57327.1 MAG: Bcr/CflA family drug resistance efflux transporter [Acidiphilium sp. 20-67-58]HQT60491.1 multidrug effflux MFS transporter [Acidiphilium sp.]HQU10461.1 multidrug effflux MFS transporter [Acidiphilium sp.]
MSSAPRAVAEAAPDLATSRRLPLLLGFLIAIGPVSVDMYLPAFPTIARQFHDPAGPGLTLAAYFAGLAAGQMTQGPFSDRAGRRLPILLGLGLYIAASIGCTLAWNTASLSWFRLLAAFGGSAAVVVPRAMVRDIADGPAAAMLFSRLMLVMGVAPIIAPILGSAVIAFGSWRWIFVLATLYGIVAIAMVWVKLPDTLPVSRRSTVGFRTIIIRYGQIAAERGFLTHALTGTFAIGALFAYLAGTPAVFIGAYHWHPLAYALLFGLNAAIYIGFNQWNPHLVARAGLRPVISASVVALLCGTIVLVVAALRGGGPLPIIAGLFICQASYGLTLPSALVAALSRHQAHAGSASALLGTWQYVGGAITGALVGAFADGTARPMAFAMFACASLAALAAAFRPRRLT